MQKDTDNVGKVMGATTKWLLGVASAITVMAIGFIFTAAVSNGKTLAVMSNGMEKVVHAVEKNTEAVRAMDKDNVDGHNIIANMIYGVKLEVGKGAVRMDTLAHDLDKAVTHMEVHEQLIPQFEAWKSKVNIHMEQCKQSLGECEDKIDAWEHKRFENGK